MSTSAARTAGLAVLSSVISREKPMSKQALLALAVSAALAAPLAEARITNVEITDRVVAFGGHSFAGVGQYEKIIGIAHGEVNPHDRRNRVIVDLDLAEPGARTSNGNVKYSFNF